MKVIMTYIGKNLSVNGYRIRGRGGVETNQVKPDVKIWMGQLAAKVENLETDVQGNLLIKLYGRFIDERATPDLHNLHKVIGDALKVGLGVDDKNFRFEDLGYSIGYPRPTLEMDLLGVSYGGISSKDS